MAGLTFMFKQSVMTSVYGGSSESWVDSSITNRLRAATDMNAAVKRELVQVTKSWLNKGTTAANRAASSDYCFILSRYELGLNVSGGTGVLGVGPNRDELYLHFESLGMKTGSSANNTIIANLINGRNSWLRDRLTVVNGSYQNAFAYGHGRIDDAVHGDIRQFDFIPCFCL